MGVFNTRPRFQDRDIRQLSGDTISLSGETNINGVFRVIPGAVTGYVLKSLDNYGTVVWQPVSVSADTNTFTTGATLSGNVIEFDRNDLSNAYSVDLNPILSGLTGVNIYNTDGVITTTGRTVSMEAKSLTFDGGITGKSDFIIIAPLLEATFTNKNVLFEVDAGTLNNYFNFDDTRSNLGFINPLNNQFIGLTITPTQVFVGTDLSGLTGFTGIQYVGDYSTNFVNRSLVDKEYVDNLIPTVDGVYLPLNVTANTQVNVTTGNLRFIATGASEIESYVLTNNQKKSVLVDNTTASLFNQAADLSQITYFVANNTQAEISYSFSGGATSLGVESGFVDIGSTVAGFQGAIYNGDYSSNFVDRSLVDKEYVDNSISGITFDNIYNINGLLTGNRLVDLGDNRSLTFSGTGNSKVINLVNTGLQIREFGVDPTSPISGVYMSTFNTSTSATTHTIVRNSDVEIAANDTILVVNTNEVSVEGDIITFPGIKYRSDYSTNFVDRSLVDKAYVDNLISGDFTANTISVTMIGSSGDCVTDLYVSNIHSCSPLNINPLNEGNVYFGSTSGVTIDVINSGLGVGTNTPTSKLDINAASGYNQLRLRTSYTPSFSGDTNGSVGDIAWDDDYIYIKTGTGWGRSSLDYTF